MVDHWVGTVEDLRAAGHLVVDVDGRPVVVVGVDDEVYAVSGRCPHMGAPMCAGTVGGTLLPDGRDGFAYALDQRVLRCPWHGWEFDLATGRSLLEPRRVGLRVFEVACEDGQVVLRTPDRGRAG